MSRQRSTGPDGVVVVDKPAGLTSHDVVARVRRLAGTRRVGHAGTLDPMATGVLVVGVQRATRVLGYLASTDKAYDATIRLGCATVTDDAEGEVLSEAPAGHLTRSDVEAAAAGLTGELAQVPSSVSAVKVGGRRAYARVRAGEDVRLEARQVLVSEFRVDQVQPESQQGHHIDVEVSVTCSTGTYVRALARDLGDVLGVGGHLRRLRRSRVGPLTLETARTLDELDREFTVQPLGEVVTAAFPRRDVGPEDARLVSHGGRLATVGLGPGPVGVFSPEGELLALVQESDDGVARPLAVFVG